MRGWASANDVVAPTVEMRGLRGQPMRFTDFRGKVLVVKLWASWCPQCRGAFPALEALRRDYQSRGVEVIAVSVDERRQDAEAFLKTLRHELRVTLDPRGRVLKAFNAPGVPSTYLIDRRGFVRFMHTGDDDRTDAAYRRQIDTLLAEPR
jgi:peroxiredoxin